MTPSSSSSRSRHDLPLGVARAGVAPADGGAAALRRAPPSGRCRARCRAPRLGQVHRRRCRGRCAGLLGARLRRARVRPSRRAGRRGARSPPVTSRRGGVHGRGARRGGPASVTRSRWRESSATSRRAASRTSTVRRLLGSAWRTAAVSTAGTPASSARPSSRAACDRLPGVPSGRRGGPPRRRARRAAARACHAASRSRARSRRRASTARPTSESGPSRTTSPRRAPPASGSGVAARPCRRSRSRVRWEVGLGRVAEVLPGASVVAWCSGACRACRRGGDQTSRRDRVAAHAAQVRPVTSRHSAAHPHPGPSPHGPATAPGQHRDPRQPGIDEGPPVPASRTSRVGRAPHGRAVRGEIERPGSVRCVAPCRHAQLTRTVRAPSRSVSAARAGADSGGALDELTRLRGAVEHREPLATWRSATSCRRHADG